LLSERRDEGVTNVIRALAALALASATAATATATSSDTLDSSAPWWEKVIVTIDGDGKPQSCRFESSLGPASAQKCDVDASQGALAKGSASKAEYTRITFERRFSPGQQPKTKLAAGETFLGGQMMALAIDAAGKVKGCEVVATSGSMTPEYGCEEAAAEKFQASAGQAANQPAREGYMTILVYGHSEHMV
jgi:hypothetical protein